MRVGEYVLGRGGATLLCSSLHNLPGYADVFMSLFVIFSNERLWQQTQCKEGKMYIDLTFLTSTLGKVEMLFLKRPQLLASQKMLLIVLLSVRLMVWDHGYVACAKHLTIFVKNRKKALISVTPTLAPSAYIIQVRFLRNALIYTSSRIHL